ERITGKAETGKLTADSQQFKAKKMPLQDPGTKHRNLGHPAPEFLLPHQGYAPAFGPKSARNSASKPTLMQPLVPAFRSRCSRILWRRLRSPFSHERFHAAACLQNPAMTRVDS